MDPALLQAVWLHGGSARAEDACIKRRPRWRSRPFLEIGSMGSRIFLSGCPARRAGLLR